MAKKKKKAVRKKAPQKRKVSYNCKGCSFKASNPASLGTHYKKHPEHRAKPKTPKKKKVVQSVALSYCPCCGTNLEIVAAAMDVAQKMEQM